MRWSMFSWCDWLNTPRNDGKPRALILTDYFRNTKNLIDQIKKVHLKKTIKKKSYLNNKVLQDFSKATSPVSFFVYVRAFSGNVDWQDWQDICLDNGQTNERLVIKTIDAFPRGPFYYYYDKLVLISRHHLGANQDWIEANEKEIMEWKFHQQNRRIRIERSLG
jgi:hypothetical protein